MASPAAPPDTAARGANRATPALPINLPRRYPRADQRGQPDPTGSTHSDPRAPAVADVLMLLTNHYGPDPRVAAEIAALRDRGYGVRLICWDRDGASAPLEEHPGLTIERIRVRSTHGRGLGQTGRLARFWAAAARQAAVRSFSLVHAHDLDAWPLGWLLARRRRVPLVLDAHESYSDMMTGHLPRAACWMLRRLENALLRRADAVVTVGDRLAAELASRGARRVCVVPNSKRAADFWIDDAARSAWRAELGIRPDQWCLGYISHLGPERPVAALMEAVSSDPRVVCVIGGGGHFAAAAAGAALRVPNIRYLGEVPPHRVPALTACFDAVFCGFDPANPNARFSAPNKLFEALAAGRPLLTGDYGEIGEIVARHGCGVIVADFSPGSIRGGLDALADPALRREAGRRAAELGRTRYDWPLVQGRLIELYERLGVRTRGSSSQA